MIILILWLKLTVMELQVTKSPRPLITYMHCTSLVVCTAFRAQIVSGESKFAEVATKESDCSSAKRAGDLGPFGRGQMQSKITIMIIS